MADDETSFEGEALQVKLDRRGPIELDDLALSFAALARLYTRHQPSPVGTDSQRPAKLFVARLETGSLIAWLAPLVPVMGQAVQVMDTSIIVREFARFLGDHIKLFLDNERGTLVSRTNPAREDIRDLREFIKPITAQPNATLRLRAARYTKQKSDGEEVSIEYVFESGDLSIAALRMDSDLVVPDLAAVDQPERHRIAKEQLMYFYQASRVVGKAKGRTGDLVVIEEISPNPIRVYFPEGAADIKRKILEDTENPFAKGYIVDVSVKYVGDEPKVYHVVRLHDVLDL